jgi:hypothetical protein
MMLQISIAYENAIAAYKPRWKHILCHFLIRKNTECLTVCASTSQLVLTLQMRVADAQILDIVTSTMALIT